MLRRLFAAITLATAAAVTVQDCGTSAGALFALDRLAISPMSPAPGDTVDLHLEYRVPDGLVVRDGTTTYDVTLNFIPLTPSTNPLCQDVPCPLGPGAYKNTTKSTWPSGVTGAFSSTMRWRDADDALLLCVKLAGRLGNLRNSPAHF
jgi:hypothetical protein